MRDVFHRTKRRNEGKICSSIIDGYRKQHQIIELRASVQFTYTTKIKECNMNGKQVSLTSAAL